MRIRIFLMTVLVLLSSLTFSQSLDEGIWQLQNPSVANRSEMMGFEKDSRFSYVVCILGSGSQSKFKGIYNLTGNSLTLFFEDGTTAAFILVWVNANKIELVSNDKIMYYAKSLSPEDHFLQNAINGINQRSNFNSGTHDIYQDAPKTCGVCLGVGRCNVCRGTGVYSAYGYSSQCSACEGTGKCWKCQGTGKK